MKALLVCGCLVALAGDSCSKQPAPKPPTKSAAAKPETGPLACPPGTALRGKTPPDGNRVWCATDDGISHGPYVAWFDDGQKKTEGAFRNGNAHGAWKHWHASGEVRTEGEFKDGEKVGKWPEFDPDGQPVKKGPKITQVREDAKGDQKDAKADLPQASHIGIPECDDYINLYSRCIEAKAPDATRAQLQDAMLKTVKGWKQVAAGPGRDHLATTCKAALDAVKKTSAAWGCEY